MTQRGLIQKTPTGVIFRITKPGVDIGAAGELDYLLHESHLCAQPYFFGYVACPFAGSTSASPLVATVAVTIPAVDASPLVLLWPVMSTGATVFPHQRASGPGSSSDGFAMDYWFVRYSVISTTRVDVTFDKPVNSLRSPAGAYLVAMRRPT